MKRCWSLLARCIAAQRLTPLVIAFFVALYIGIAFFNDEALTTLISLTRSSAVLTGLLLLIPLNVLARLVLAANQELARRRAIKGSQELPPASLFTEQVILVGSGELSQAKSWLTAAGYRVMQGNGSLSAVRGVSLFPARFLWLLGVLLLFLGITFSVAGREVRREAVVEGEPLPGYSGLSPRVERIELRELGHALLLARDLTITVGNPAGVQSRFCLYPPGVVDGRFLYPRYLGVAPLVEFSAPDLRPGVADYYLLMIYPPGREDSITIPDAPYTISIRLVEPVAGEDPYITGRFVFHFKVVKEGALFFEGEAPVGGAFTASGHRIAFPEARKIVATDFIRDYGVPMIWLATLLFVAALLFYLPVRFGNPRREILLLPVNGDIYAFSRAEGRRRKHAEVYHETLDLLAA